MTGLVVLKTTDSEFHSFYTDRYTTLAPRRRTASWPPRSPRSGGTRGAPPDWDAVVRARARGRLTRRVRRTTYSLALQQTLYAMGEAVLDGRPGVGEIRMSLPNKHHFLIDLSPFG